MRAPAATLAVDAERRILGLERIVGLAREVISWEVFSRMAVLGFVPEQAVFAPGLVSDKEAERRETAARPNADRLRKQDCQVRTGILAVPTWRVTPLRGVRINLLDRLGCGEDGRVLGNRPVAVGASVD
jgi:hypothetical protein